MGINTLVLYLYILNVGTVVSILRAYCRKKDKIYTKLKERFVHYTEFMYGFTLHETSKLV